MRYFYGSRIIYVTWSLICCKAAVNFYQLFYCKRSRGSAVTGGGGVIMFWDTAASCWLASEFPSCLQTKTCSVCIHWTVPYIYVQVLTQLYPYKRHCWCLLCCLITRWSSERSIYNEKNPISRCYTECFITVLSLVGIWKVRGRVALPRGFRHMKLLSTFCCRGCFIPGAAKQTTG